MYADRCGAEEVQLLLSDREKKKSREETIVTDTIEHEGRELMVFGM